MRGIINSRKQKRIKFNKGQNFMKYPTKLISHSIIKAMSYSFLMFLLIVSKISWLNKFHNTYLINALRINNYSNYTWIKKITFEARLSKFYAFNKHIIS